MSVAKEGKVFDKKKTLQPFLYSHEGSEMGCIIFLQVRLWRSTLVPILSQIIDIVEPGLKKSIGFLIFNMILLKLMPKQKLISETKCLWNNQGLDSRTEILTTCKLQIAPIQNKDLAK